MVRSSLADDEMELLMYSDEGLLLMDDETAWATRLDLADEGYYGA